MEEYIVGHGVRMSLAQCHMRVAVWRCLVWGDSVAQGRSGNSEWFGPNLDLFCRPAALQPSMLDRSFQGVPTSKGSHDMEEASLLYEVHPLGKICLYAIETSLDSRWKQWWKDCWKVGRKLDASHDMIIDLMNFILWFHLGRERRVWNLPRYRRDNAVLHRLALFHNRKVATYPGAYGG